VAGPAARQAACLNLRGGVRANVARMAANRQNAGARRDGVAPLSRLLRCGRYHFPALLAGPIGRSPGAESAFVREVFPFQKSSRD
jgi:hypothetical protein